jgi:hypothetical protein
VVGAGQRFGVDLELLALGDIGINGGEIVVVTSVDFEPLDVVDRSGAEAKEVLAPELNGIVALAPECPASGLVIQI